MNVPRQWHNKDTPGNGGFAMFCSDFIVSPPTEDVNKKTHICEVCLLGSVREKEKRVPFTPAFLSALGSLHGADASATDLYAQGITGIGRLTHLPKRTVAYPRIRFVTCATRWWLFHQTESGLNEENSGMVS